MFYFVYPKLNISINTESAVLCGDDFIYKITCFHTFIKLILLLMKKNQLFAQLYGALSWFFLYSNHKQSANVSWFTSSVCLPLCQSCFFQTYSRAKTPNSIISINHYKHRRYLDFFIGANFPGMLLSSEVPWCK